MATDYGIRKGPSYDGEQEQFNNDVIVLDVLCTDVINQIIIDKGSDDVSIQNVLTAFERIQSCDPYLIERLGAFLGNISIKNAEDLPSVSYEVILRNSKDKEKLTYNIYC